MLKSISLDLTKQFNCLMLDLAIPSDTVSYLNHRLKNEGYKFLTVTLPKLGSLLLEALELGSLALLNKREYSMFRWKGNAPVHFAGLISQIFCIKTGVVLAKVDELAIWQVRQLSQYFYKLSLDFTEDQLEQAEDSFKKCETEVPDTCIDIPFIELMRKNLENFYTFPKIEDVLSACRPRFGPGTFANDSKNRDPYYVQKAYDHNCQGNFNLPKFKGISGFLKRIPSLKHVGFVSNDTSNVSEVLFVPKDSRGPRVISREPLHSLRAQMSFFDYFSSFFEKKTCNRINFTDQKVNRELARQGSITGEWSTLDLKEASDRIPYAVVLRLARYIPALRFFLKFRTPVAKLPSGELISLNKLSGMGSGLTFVWLALICHTAIATEISITKRIPYAQASKEVYVYGDDIIVRTCHVDIAKSSLARIPLKVNESKSFTKRTSDGCFRESCGGDYYNGADVGIIRFKAASCKPMINSVSKQIMFGSNDAAVTTISEHAGLAVSNGFTNLSEYLYTQIEKVCGKLPLNAGSTAAISRKTLRFVMFPESKTGQYSTLRVFCPMPRFLESNAISDHWHYASALKGSSASLLDLSLYGSTSSTEQFQMAVPRDVRLVSRRVSSIDFSSH